MKLIFSIFIIITILTFIINKQFDDTQCVENDESDSDSNLINSQDKELESIREYMWEIAENIDRRTNIKLKKIEAGILPDEYPEEMKLKAKKIHQDRSQWQKVMLYPTAVWRMCIFPNFKINYVSWCHQTHALDRTRSKLNGCMNNFCLVCCDHLQLNFKEVANNNEIGEKFSLHKDLGFSNIKFIVTDKEINECRNACKNQYPIEMPLILPTPPRDPTLGTSLVNPGISCNDIKKWGSENAKSGVYWIEVSSKGKIAVYCDMETDGGGWTLFYNYRHLPGQDMILNSSKMPSNLEENSHMHLTNAGFTNQDVKELRFLCTERYGQQRIYWHFKTSSEDFIQTALTGEQEYLGSTISSYTELPIPSKLIGKYKRRVYDTMMEELNYYGTSSNSGFTGSPFGLPKYKAYWTVIDSSVKYPRYECATSHNYVGGYSSKENSPNMVNSHHMIWFRGDPPNEDRVKIRLISRIRSDPS